MGKLKTKAAPGAKTGAAQTENQQGKISDNSTRSQRMRLLQKLREMGLVIHTVWVSEKTATGRTRHLARYVLVREVCHE